MLGSAAIGEFFDEFGAPFDSGRMGTTENMLMFFGWVVTEGAAIGVFWVVPVSNVAGWEIVMAKFHEVSTAIRVGVSR